MGPSAVSLRYLWGPRLSNFKMHFFLGGVFDVSIFRELTDLVRGHQCIQIGPQSRWSNDYQCTFEFRCHPCTATSTLQRTRDRFLRRSQNSYNGQEGKIRDVRYVYSQYDAFKCCKHAYSPPIDSYDAAETKNIWFFFLPSTKTSI